jgi:hypothetical protein
MVMVMVMVMMMLMPVLMLLMTLLQPGGSLGSAQRERGLHGARLAGGTPGSRWLVKTASC